MIKTCFLSFAFVIFLGASAPAAEEVQATGKPQGMTLRLELFVTDLGKSLDFYTKVLGFERLPGEPTYAPVRSGAVVIGLGPRRRSAEASPLQSRSPGRSPWTGDGDRARGG